jgi:hypothetical protein
VRRSATGSLYAVGRINLTGHYVLTCSIHGKHVLGSPVSFLAITQGDMQRLHACISDKCLSLDAELLVDSYSIDTARVTLSDTHLQVLMPNRQTITIALSDLQVCLRNSVLVLIRMRAWCVVHNRLTRCSRRGMAALA